MRLAIICTHPIQYYAPVFKLLARKTELKVFYTAGHSNHFDKGFNQFIEWDIPLLDGYDYEFLINNAKGSGSHGFLSIRNPMAKKKILSFNPEYLLIYGWCYLSHLKLLYYFKGKIPILFRGDSTLLPRQLLLRSVVRNIVLRNVYKHIDKALFTGTNNKEYFKNYGVKEHDLIFVPHATDNERFSERPVTNVRVSLNIDERDIVVLFAGKFERVKNPLLLLQAFKELDHPGVHLLYVGDGKLKKRLKLLSRDFSKIHFMPFQNQSVMPAIYQACDLFCLPSRSETWGLSINEAMAVGKAIIASNKCGAAIDLVSSANGKVFKSRDLSDLKKNLLILLSDKQQLKVKGENSSEIISSWSFENQVKNILDAITQ